MDKKSWQRIEEILDKTFDLNEEDFKRFIETEIQDDALKKEIFALLRAEKTAPEFLDSGIDGLLTSNQTIHTIADSLKNHPVEIDRYKISDEIGRGGMSVVYKARRTDGEFDQNVAIKIMQPFGADREDRFRRLREERQILASLNHPNIATVFDGGITPEGWPYMVMELVNGQHLNEYCNQKNIGLRARLRLFLTICDTVNYAHQNLILHRDLKPANILITPDGRVKLLDFGIAKLLNEDGSAIPLTRTGAPLLTPEYAAPEQFRKEPVATSVDVYSLGVLLYELLTGVRPFDLSTKTFFEINQIIQEQEPAKPSEKCTLHTISPSELRGDLDIICLKALRKEPGKRYLTVRDLAEDITRYLTGVPISARPATKSYRIRKFVQRHRTGVIAATVFLLILTGFITLLINQQAITTQERDRALEMSEQVQAELERSNTLRSFLVDMFRANIPDRPQDELPTTEQLLEAGVERALDPESGNSAIRADMLTVIASIYEPQNRLERALELTNTAIELIENDTLNSKDQLIAAWHLHSRISLRQRKVDQAEASLLKSYQLIPAEMMTSDNELRLALDIARIRLQNGEYAQAEKLMQPHIKNVFNGVEYQPHLINRLLWDTGILYNLTNEFEKSLEARIALNTHSKNLHGATSLNYTVSLANTALTQVQLGHITDAEETLSEVLVIYDEIFNDQPSEYRGAALHTLARLRRYTGQFNEALQTARFSSEQWAAATERENLDEYVWLHFNQAEILVAAQRWDEALPVLEHTKNLLENLQPPMPGRLSLVEANIARIFCQNGNLSEGANHLAAIKHRLDLAETEFMNTDDNLAFYQADGICSMAHGRFEDAILSFNSALQLPIPPGQFATSALINIYIAMAMDAMGQTEFAMQHLKKAEQLFLENDAHEHPYIDMIENRFTIFPGGTLTQSE